MHVALHPAFMLHHFRPEFVPKPQFLSHPIVIWDRELVGVEMETYHLRIKLGTFETQQLSGRNERTPKTRKDTF